ncbi:von Willebrand factor A domain-containing protein 7 [Triplophysa tibetana]|uniref:von Willebrand factor A domain-containing protein 7 n=1 Tax=Triplophysa tibetana TaxID=1572043 RepID=A0A5A9PJW8_9TELE|nr:von Willebrand factor A domain-containing protein 7 [Triplophysa tibetana]
MMMKSSVSAVALMALVVSSAQAFLSVGGNGNTHVTISGSAIMTKTYEVCKAVAKSEGREFEPTGSSVEELLRACMGTAIGEVSGAKLLTALNQIYMQNGLVDRNFMSSAPHHFNNEAFSEGRNLIIQGIAAVKANVRADNLQSAREMLTEGRLGRLCHTLQVFMATCSNILNDHKMPTCSDCASGQCPNSLLPAILNGKFLTSGYMGLFSSVKPQGKCSHGGDADLSSTQNPRGGISKDESHSYNSDLHNTAVNLAANATLELLEDVRVVIGDKEYLRTRDPDAMKSKISNLKANGGGDLPEMCLSALQLALVGAPSSSHIYVFTDAPAKDVGLQKTIISLIRSTKSTVSFFMTSARTRKRDITADPRTDFQVYYDVALASGGQAIEVSKSSLSQATDIIVDTSTSVLVTILQCSRSPGHVEGFPFLLDESVSNATVYVTGNGLAYTLRSPSGLSQSSTVLNGILGTIHKVGNLERIQLNGTEKGLWHIDMTSTKPYTIKITGQSTITFIYDFVEEFKGPHPGYAVIDGHPPADFPAKLLLTLTGEKGPEVLEVQEVSLVEVSGLTVSKGTTEKMSNGNVLVTVTEVPEEFVVLLKGKDMTSDSLFQRQTTTQMSQSKLAIKLKRALLFFHHHRLNLESGGSAQGKVSLTPPVDTVSGTDVTLTLEAEAPGGTDSNFAVLRLSVVSKATDLTPPECKMFDVQGHCSSSSCSSSIWELYINITDGPGSGIESVTVQQGSGNFTQNELEDGNVTMVTGHYEALCCSPSVTLASVDKVGNVGRCSFKIEISAGSALVSMTVPLWACLLAFALSLLCDTFSL